MSNHSVYELMDSMSGSITNESEGGEVCEVNRRFLIGRCPGGFDEAVTAIEPYAPQYANSSGSYWLRKRLEIQGVGNAYFDCTATYQTLQPKEKENDNNNNSSFTPGTIAWDTTGHTEHITQSLSTRKAPDNAPDYNNAIGVSGESVNGVDVVRPSLRYSETWIMPVAIATSCDFIGNVYRLTGTVNMNKFRCFDMGEALFMGARGQWSGDQPYVAVTFDFQCRTKSNIWLPDFYGSGAEYSPGGDAPGGVGGLVVKNPWDYVWFVYQSDVQAGSLVKKPTAVYAETVYDYRDWSGLQITDAQIGQQQAGVQGQAAAAGGNGVA